MGRARVANGLMPKGLLEVPPKDFLNYRLSSCQHFLVTMWATNLCGLVTCCILYGLDASCVPHHQNPITKMQYFDSISVSKESIMYLRFETETDETAAIRLVWLHGQ